MKTLLYGLAALPLIATVALAEPATPPTPAPIQLSENQMDSVTAGFKFFEITESNNSITTVSVDGPAQAPTNILPPCAACFLSINNFALSVQSIMKGGLPATP